MEALKKDYGARGLPVTAYGNAVDTWDAALAKVGTTYAVPKHNVSNFSASTLSSSNTYKA